MGVSGGLTLECGRLSPARFSSDSSSLSRLPSLRMNCPSASLYACRPKLSPFPPGLSRVNHTRVGLIAISESTCALISSGFYVEVKSQFYAPSSDSSFSSSLAGPS